LIFKKTAPATGTVNYGGQRQKHGEMPELHIPAFIKWWGLTGNSQPDYLSLLTKRTSCP